VRDEPRSAINASQFNALSPDEQPHYKPRELDQYFYYFTRYGSPLAYIRPYDILCTQLGGHDALRGKRVLDFGYGGIAHLRLLASVGCDVVGVDVDPILHALYSAEEDTGLIEGMGFEEAKAPDGSLLLLQGPWPSTDAIVSEVGEGFDIFLSKNTLKRGYIHPHPPEGQTVDPRKLVHLGVDDESFVRHVARVLKPGGLWMVYNICPAPAKEGEEYKPWADGRFPFSRELVEREGFEVVAWEQDDATTMREYAKVLGWDAGNNPMDLENDFFVNYTLLRRDDTPSAQP
jgi:SAM-dependent methyltransferase